MRIKNLNLKTQKHHVFAYLHLNERMWWEDTCVDRRYQRGVRRQAGVTRRSGRSHRRRRGSRVRRHLMARRWARHEDGLQGMLVRLGRRRLVAMATIGVRMGLETRK